MLEKDVVSRLCEALKVKTKDQLSKQLNVSRTTLWKWKKNNKISPRFLPIVSQKSGISFQELNPDFKKQKHF